MRLQLSTYDVWRGLMCTLCKLWFVTGFVQIRICICSRGLVWLTRCEGILLRLPRSPSIQRRLSSWCILQPSSHTSWMVCRKSVVSKEYGGSSHSPHSWQACGTLAHLMEQQNPEVYFLKTAPVDYLMGGKTATWRLSLVRNTQLKVSAGITKATRGAPKAPMNCDK